MAKKKSGSLSQADLDNRSRQLNDKDPLYYKTRGLPLPDRDHSSGNTNPTSSSSEDESR